MSTANHESYPRRVLICVTGLTPQIVTETLYALAITRDPPFLPTEIHVLTTAEGAHRVRLTLLDEEQGHFHKLRRDYRLDAPIEFGEQNIHVVRDAQDKPLDDIRGPEDNNAAADQITAFIREISDDPTTRIHLSLAGGRKTMGFFAGYALSLFGRDQDELSHVLVSEPFEQNHRFYYPPPEPEILLTHDKRPVSTRDARVTLAYIPFVRLRHGIPAHLARHARFSEVVKAAQNELGPPRLTIDLKTSELHCGEHTCKLQPQLLAWYTWMATRRKQAKPHGGYIHWSEAEASEFLACYATIAGLHSHGYEQTSQMLAEGFKDKDYFLEKNARVNKALKNALGTFAEPWLIHAQGKRPRTRYGLSIAPEHITITGIGAPAAPDRALQ